MMLPEDPYLEHLQRAISEIPQQPHHRRAVQIISNEVDLTKHDICHRPLQFTRSSKRLRIPCDIIGIAGGPLWARVLIAGIEGPIIRFRPPFPEIIGQDADVILRLVRECREMAR